MSASTKEREDWGYTYDLLAFKVDTMNERLQETKVIPIQHVMDDNNIPKEKRIKLLNDMINTLGSEIGKRVANGELI